MSNTTQKSPFHWVGVVFALIMVLGLAHKVAGWAYDSGPQVRTEYEHKLVSLQDAIKTEREAYKKYALAATAQFSQIEQQLEKAGTDNVGYAKRRASTFVPNAEKWRLDNVGQFQVTFGPGGKVTDLIPVLNDDQRELLSQTDTENRPYYGGR